MFPSGACSYVAPLQVNSLCVWQYNRRGDIEVASLEAENLDMTLPTPHMDSASLLHRSRRQCATIEGAHDLTSPSTS